jgi:eukaryotic-like serine/threonine-protein kinase
VGFFADGQLKKLDTASGTISDVCPVESVPMGGAWSSRGVIVFATFGSALRQVSDAGGIPEPIPGIQLSTSAQSHFWPAFLPDGKHLLFLEWAAPPSAGRVNTVWAASLDGDTPRRLPLASTRVQFVNGHVLFTQAGDLFAQRFNPARLELSGQPLPLARGVQVDPTFYDAAVTVSATGILVYANRGTGVNSELTWLDRSGKSIGTVGEPAQFMTLAISPDAQRVAVAIKDSVDGERIWVYDAGRGARIPLSPNAHDNPWSPVWSPDGRWIAFRKIIDQGSAVFVHASDGSGSDRQIGATSSEIIGLNDWSHDGQYLILDSWPISRPGGLHTVQAWPVAGDSRAVARLDNATQAALTHDGHWIAYSDATDDQLYVTSFPRPGPRIAIAAGGHDPRWRADGKELFYIANDRTITAVEVRETAAHFSVAASHALFRLSLPQNVGFYDVTPDGQRFLTNTRTHLEQSAPLTVISDWPALFRVASNTSGPRNGVP